MIKQSGAFMGALWVFMVVIAKCADVSVHRRPLSPKSLVSAAALHSHGLHLSPDVIRAEDSPLSLLQSVKGQFSVLWCYRIFPNGLLRAPLCRLSRALFVMFWCVVGSCI